jgi:hypothetical protein
MDQSPANPRGRGCSIMMLALLLLLIAALMAWGWLDSPPDAPQPSATAAPPAMPGGEGPPPQP